MKPLLAAAALWWAVSAIAAAADDGPDLRGYLLRSYPSLLYVDRYREDFRDEAQGSATLWSSSSPPKINTRDDVVRALVGLEDQHVALTGPKAGKAETLGILFRTSSDGHMIVWRVFDPSVARVRAGDDVLAVDGIRTSIWLSRAAAVTFGGNRRSRAAEAALELGLGTRAEHETARSGNIVHLTLQTRGETPRTLALGYLAMTDDRVRALTAAIDRADLPPVIEMGRYRIGTVRLGAFAPQYDSDFINASNAAAKIAGTTDDRAMLAGFCAVVTRFVSAADVTARHADVLVLDLRGNFGGFGREARLLAMALATAALPDTYDVFATGKRGAVRLEREPNDPSCGHANPVRPVAVLTDAGTRSAGELMSAWLWASGTATAGERTIGAGGGFEAGSTGFPLRQSGYAVRASGNFTFFDPRRQLRSGETAEAPLIDLVSQHQFAPDRTRPFAIQAAGLRPDVEAASTAADLRDGGVSEVKRMIAQLRARRLLP